MRSKSGRFSGCLVVITPLFTTDPHCHSTERLSWRSPKWSMCKANASNWMCLKMVYKAKLCQIAILMGTILMNLWVWVFPTFSDPNWVWSQVSYVNSSLGALVTLLDISSRHYLLHLLATGLVWVLRTLKTETDQPKLITSHSTSSTETCLMQPRQVFDMLQLLP